MMNITISIDEETYRRLHARAEELNMSIAGMVEKYLASVSSQEHRQVSPEEFERLVKQEAEITRGIRGFSGSDRLSREELYDRKRS